MQKLKSAGVIVETFLCKPGATCVEIQLLGDGDLVAVVLHSVCGIDKVELEQLNAERAHHIGAIRSTPLLLR